MKLTSSASFAEIRSGKLNAKHRELVDLQKQAQARLAKTRERFQEGMRDAREVRGDLEWTQKKVSYVSPCHLDRTIPTLPFSLSFTKRKERWMSNSAFSPLTARVSFDPSGDGKKQIRDPSSIISRETDRQPHRSLQTKASRKHPKEYAKARARYPSPEC
jgi:hypothetical protein